MLHGATTDAVTVFFTGDCTADEDSILEAE